MFITLQRYEILSKSQHLFIALVFVSGVYHSAKIRNFKQITTPYYYCINTMRVFITLQRYEILSKSQQHEEDNSRIPGVYHSAKIRNFKQITTNHSISFVRSMVFITLQRYEILSKSQQHHATDRIRFWCLSLCKDTKF